MKGASIAELLAQYFEILVELDRTADESERLALIAQARTLTCEFNDLWRIHKDARTVRRGMDPFSWVELLLNPYTPPPAVETQLNIALPRLSSLGRTAKKVKKGMAEPDPLTRKSKFDFVCTELDLGITFCEVALTVQGEENIKRNIRRGEEAYIAAKRFLKGRQLSERMQRELQPRVDQLESLLTELHRRPVKSGAFSVRVSFRGATEGDDSSASFRGVKGRS